MQPHDPPPPSSSEKGEGNDQTTKHKSPPTSPSASGGQHPSDPEALGKGSLGKKPEKRMGATFPPSKGGAKPGPYAASSSTSETNQSPPEGQNSLLKASQSLKRKHSGELLAPAKRSSDDMETD